MRVCGKLDSRTGPDVTSSIGNRASWTQYGTERLCYGLDCLARRHHRGRRLWCGGCSTATRTARAEIPQSAGAAGTGGASGAPGSSTTAPTASQEAAGSPVVGGAAAGGAAMTAPERPNARGGRGRSRHDGRGRADDRAGCRRTGHRAGRRDVLEHGARVISGSGQVRVGNAVVRDGRAHRYPSRHGPPRTCSRGPCCRGGSRISGSHSSCGRRAGGAPVHHPEYTEPHAPTLPGAESARRGTSRATTSSPRRIRRSRGEPTGHLATEQPYGEGIGGSGGRWQRAGGIHRQG